MKYRLNLRAVWATDSTRFRRALIHFLETECRMAVIQEGDIVYYNRRLGLNNMARLKAFAYGLSFANYDSE
jgi:hypothetical protein